MSNDIFDDKGYYVIVPTKPNSVPDVRFVYMTSYGLRSEIKITPIELKKLYAGQSAVREFFDKYDLTFKKNFFKGE